MQAKELKQRADKGEIKTKLAKEFGITHLLQLHGLSKIESFVIVGYLVGKSVKSLKM